MSYDMGFGVVYFDDANEHSRGYYARAGEKARRLSGNHCGDLATDVVWLTNLNYETMRSAHMYPHARYRRNDFLGETFKNLLARLGFFDMTDAVTCQEGVEQVALLFERVMRYAHVYGGFETVPMYNLRTGFREKFSHIDPQVTPDLLKALIESESYFISVERPVGNVTPAWLPLYLPPLEVPPWFRTRRSSMPPEWSVGGTCGGSKCPCSSVMNPVEGLNIGRIWLRTFLYNGFPLLAIQWGSTFDRSF